MNKMIAVSIGLIALGIGQITAGSTWRTRQPAGTVMVQDASGYWHIQEQPPADTSMPDTPVPEPTPAPEQPGTIGYASVTITIILAGRGGDAFYECSPGRLPWNGSCRRTVIHQAIPPCGFWTDSTSSTTYSRQACDGTVHTFTTKTFWIKRGNNFYNVGSVTPSITMPSFCGPTTQLTTYGYITANIPNCPTVCGDPTSWWCACPESPEHYIPDPTCCTEDFTFCGTCYAFVYFCCCCRETPYGWVCQ